MGINAFIQAFYDQKRLMDINVGIGCIKLSEGINSDLVELVAWNGILNGKIRERVKERDYFYIAGMYAGGLYNDFRRMLPLKVASKRDSGERMHYGQRWNFEVKGEKVIDDYF